MNRNAKAEINRSFFILPANYTPIQHMFSVLWHSLDTHADTSGILSPTPP